MRNLLLFGLILFFQMVDAQNFDISSPDGQIELNVSVDSQISWAASFNGERVIEKAMIGMDFSGGQNFGVKPKVKKWKEEKVSNKIFPGVSHKDAEIQNEFVQLTLSFKGKYNLNFRVYNDGIAYQFVDQGKESRQVVNERLSLTFPTGSRSLFPQEESMYSHNERLYLDKALPEISETDFCSLPVLFNTGKARVLYTETALHDYPGMFLRGNGNNTMDTKFPPYVLEAVPAKNGPDRNQDLVQVADYIAEVSGLRTYPWRVFIVSDDDRTFVETNLTYQLSRPEAELDFNWVKPGKVAWDWYNANNVYGVSFKSGLNTATYKYYIDFASKNGIEYVILDEGWTESTTHILAFNPDMDVKELIRYGEEKGVGIILWVLWKPLDENLLEILKTYKSWGAKGIKVDFMQRNDQYMVSSYERIARECAKLELLVDFHGAFKPSGLRRMYPNILNYEGVKGSENNKWSADITPTHNVTIPFIRMAAGPMDYTPGSMVNRIKNNYAISFERPMSLGTRAHQVAMYVVYEAPLQMLCESPARYYEEQETVDFITQIPTVWDETLVIHGKVGEYIAIARKKGNNWYLGAMTDWSPREMEIDFSFLGEGDYQMQIFRDGVNADRFAEDYTTEAREVSSGSKLRFAMASGGGWSAILEPKE